jgi:hypothetical protein
MASGKIGKNEAKRMKAQALQEFMSETGEEERAAMLRKGTTLVTAATFPTFPRLLYHPQRSGKQRAARGRCGSSSNVAICNL